MNSNSSSSPSQEPSGRSILVKICQQIQQQIQNLLNNLNMQSTSQINNRLLEKCITSTKMAIMRVLSGRLPQIVAIEEKCKMLVIEINQQLEMQKLKAKDIFNKYEALVLQCDRYKMETVQLSELYSAVYNQNLQLKMQKEQHDQNVQTDCMDDLQIQQRQEQRKLYHQELARYNEMINELHRNEEVSNQRIYNLLEEDKNKQDIIDQNYITIQMLKKELSDLVIEAEELKHRIEEEAHNHQSEKQKMLNQHQIGIKEAEKKVELLSVKLQQCQEENRKAEIRFAQLQSSYEDLRQQAKLKDSIIGKQSSELSELKHWNSELEARVGKIKDISRNQEKLQGKYSKKMDLLIKQNAELSEKLKFLKSENERLYQAMEQYATKELKLTNALQSVQTKLQKLKQQEQKMLNLKGKFTQFCLHAKKEIQGLKKHIEKSIKKTIAQFLEELISSKSDYQSKMTRKIDELAKQRETQRQTLLARIKHSQQQYLRLQQKSLDSQINANKVANALVDSKNLVYSQITEKDSIIRQLEKQIAKQKQANDASTKKIAYILQKYSKFESIGEDPTRFEQNNRNQSKLNLQLVQHKNRLAALQREFRAFAQI